MLEVGAARGRPAGTRTLAKRPSRPSVEPTRFAKLVRMAETDVSASSIQRPDGMDAEPPDAAPFLPEHRDGQRRVSPGRGRRRAAVGERGLRVVRARLDDDALDPARLALDLDGPARLDQQRPDDVLLLRDRARGAARVRPRRAARASAGGAAAARRPRRDGRARADLSGDQRRTRLGPRLGSRDVDRHGVRPRAARARRIGPARPPARVSPDGRGRGRHHRAAGDRDRLQRLDLGRPAPRRVRHLRLHPHRPRCGHPLRPRLLRARHRRLGRVLRVRRGSGGGGPHGRRDRARVSGAAERPRARQRPLPPLPGAADRRALADGAVGAAVGRLAERAAAVALASVDELRDRPAVRARERRRPPQRRLPLDRIHVAGDARDPVRLRARQADRDRRRELAGDQAQPRPPAPAGRLGVGARRGDDRRDRLHGLDPHRRSRLPRRRARRGEGGHPQRGARSRRRSPGSSCS